MRIKLLGEKDWIHPLDGAIDVDNWDKKDKKEYLDKPDFKLPPLKNPGEELRFTIGQLTPVQLDRLQQIQSQITYGGVNLNTLLYSMDGVPKAGMLYANHKEWVEFIVRCGVKNWKNYELEYKEDGEVKIEKIKPEYTETIWGKYMTEKSYQDLLRFFLVSIGHIAVAIYTYSLTN